jgi:tetratricopeptide (TPR) repeat protein
MKAMYEPKEVTLVRTSFVVTFVVLLIACGHVGAQHQAESRTDVITRMAEYTREGHYEESIQAGMNALENKPSDEVVLRQIAIVYLIRGDKDREHTEQSVKQAIIFAEKSLAINPANYVGRYEAARIFEHSGDLSKADKCSLYSRALKTLAEWFSTLQGENIAVEEKSFPTAPLRKEADATKSRIEGKLAQSHCG